MTILPFVRPTPTPKPVARWRYEIVIPASNEEQRLEVECYAAEDADRLAIGDFQTLSPLHDGTAVVFGWMVPGASLAVV